MKTQLITLLFGFISAFAQNHVNKAHSIPIDSAKKIVISLEDKVVLTSWDLKRIDIDVDIEIKGIHWAFGGGKDELRQYDIIWSEENDTLYIQPKKIKQTATVGVTWLSSKHSHHLHLPKGLDITFRSEKCDIEIQGRFSKLDIINMRGSTKLDVQKTYLKFLECECTDLDNFIKVNGKRIRRKHLYLGEGTDWVSALTMDGDIELTLTE